MMRYCLTLIRPDTFTNKSGQMGSNLTPNIFCCIVTPPVCFTALELFLLGKVIEHTWALYQTFLNPIFIFLGKFKFEKIIKK